MKPVGTNVGSANDEDSAATIWETGQRDTGQPQSIGSARRLVSPYQCVSACVEILEQKPPTPGDAQLPSWHSMTEAEVLSRLPRIASVAAQVEGGLQRWVGEARRRGSSWASIGESLGMSRQSAWERFSSDASQAA